MFHTIVSIKNDGHYFCRAGGNRPDGLNEPVTYFPDVLRLIFEEQLSVRAIALEQLGLSHSTVHNIFQRFNASGM
ncbi:protein of unknown function [Escherichia coli]|nr:protein of unknown function [Escherichia coli]